MRLTRDDLPLSFRTVEEQEDSENAHAFDEAVREAARYVPNRLVMARLDVLCDEEQEEVLALVVRRISPEVRDRLFVRLAHVLDEAFPEASSDGGGGPDVEK